MPSIKTIPNYDVRKDFNLRDILLDLSERLETLEDNSKQQTESNNSARVNGEKIRAVYQKISEVVQDVNFLLESVRDMKKERHGCRELSEKVLQQEEQLNLCQNKIRDQDEDMQSIRQEFEARQQQSSRFSEDEIKELKNIIHRQRFTKDDYFMKTILISGCSPIEDMSLSYYDRVKKMLSYNGLGDLLSSAHKFYLTSTGNIRLTFLDSRDAARHLMFAKWSLKRMQGSRVQVQRMVPNRMLPKKKALLRLGAEMKKSGQISSFDVLMKDSTCKLRVYNRERNIVEFLDTDDRQEMEIET